jgi:hypothetical protein
MTTPPAHPPPAMTEDEVKALGEVVGIIGANASAINNTTRTIIEKSKGKAGAAMIMLSAQRSPFADPEDAYDRLAKIHLPTGLIPGIDNVLPQALRAALLLTQDPTLPVYWGFSQQKQSPPEPNDGEGAKDYILRIWGQINSFNKKIKFGMLVIALGLVGDDGVETDETVDDALERRLGKVEQALGQAQLQLKMLKMFQKKLEGLMAEKLDAEAHGKTWTPPKWKDLVKAVQEQAKGEP